MKHGFHGFRIRKDYTSDFQEAFPAPTMIINADTLVPHLREKVRPTQIDASRHLLCPHCERRTRLNTLADGRRKCTVCGRKFRIHKVTDDHRLQQCAEILLCFCIDFSAHRTAQITHHAFRIVSLYFDHFRALLTTESLSQEKIKIFTDHRGDIQVSHNKNLCRWCQSKMRSGEAEHQPPVFGVQMKNDGTVFIDPLKDDEAVLYFHTSGLPVDTLPGRSEGYAGFICCGKFHHFTQEKQKKSATGQLWAWIQDRIKSHRGIWKRNTGYYLKELEWKYNYRSLEPDRQAMNIIELMPTDFLSKWSLGTKDPPTERVLR
jgi:transposase-like protein